MIANIIDFIKSVVFNKLHNSNRLFYLANNLFKSSPDRKFFLKALYISKNSIR